MKTRIIPALHITLKPSYYILGCYALLSTTCLLAILQTELPASLKIVIVVVTIIAVIFCIWQDALLRFSWSWRSVEVTSQGKVRISNQRQETFEVELLASSVCHPWLIVLCFKRLGYRQGLRNSMMITPWQVQDLQQHRKLRVWLNWGKALTNKHQPLDQLPE